MLKFNHMDSENIFLYMARFMIEPTCLAVDNFFFFCSCFYTMSNLYFLISGPVMHPNRAICHLILSHLELKSFE